MDNSVVALYIKSAMAVIVGSQIRVNLFWSTKEIHFKYGKSAVISLKLI
jgi:hypothetical protein